MDSIEHSDPGGNRPASPRLERSQRAPMVTLFGRVSGSALEAADARPSRRQASNDRRERDRS